MWQQVYQKHRDKFNLLAVAMDVQGPDKPRVYAEKAKAAYPVAVDQENVLGKMFNFKAIPNAIFVDEGGIVRYAKFGGFDIRKPEFAKITEDWITGSTKQDVLAISEVEADRGMKHPEALRFYDEGLHLYRAGKRTEAAQAWRKVIAIEPDNYIVRKNMWVVEHPERFYGDEIDNAWQREQIAKGQ